MTSLLICLVFFACCARAVAVRRLEMARLDAETARLRAEGDRLRDAADRLWKAVRS